MRRSQDSFAWWYHLLYRAEYTAPKGLDRKSSLFDKPFTT